MLDLALFVFFVVIWNSCIIFCLSKKNILFDKLMFTRFESLKCLNITSNNNYIFIFIIIMYFLCHYLLFDILLQYKVS